MHTSTSPPPAPPAPPAPLPAAVLVRAVSAMTAHPRPVRISRTVADEIPTAAALVAAVHRIGDEPFQRQQHQKFHKVAAASRRALNLMENIVLLRRVELHERPPAEARRVFVERDDAREHRS